MCLIEPAAEYSKQIKAYLKTFTDSGDSMDGTGERRKGYATQMPRAALPCLQKARHHQSADYLHQRK